MDAATRKQYGDLTLADFAACAVWVFALDEEDVEGQDEETVRPRLDHGGSAWQGDLVATSYTTADGRTLRGFMTATPEPASWDACFPEVLVDGLRVTFWYGVVRPTAEQLAEDVAAVGGPSAFPLVGTPDVAVPSNVPPSLVIPAIEALAGLGVRRRIRLAPSMPSRSIVHRILGRR